MATKATTKEDSKIERRRGGYCQPTVKNGGDRGNGEEGLIATVGVKQPADDAAR